MRPYRVRDAHFGDETTKICKEEITMKVEGVIINCDMGRVNIDVGHRKASGKAGKKYIS